jgi:pyruvate carboxylase
LPKAGPVNIKVFDISGRNVWTYVSTAKAGQNALTITRDQLSGATGVMIYKIESGEFTGQKKMIVID